MPEPDKVDINYSSILTSYTALDKSSYISKPRQVVHNSTQLERCCMKSTMPGTFFKCYTYYYRHFLFFFFFVNLFSLPVLSLYPSCLEVVNTKQVLKKSLANAFYYRLNPAVYGLALSWHLAIWNIIIEQHLKYFYDVDI